VTQRLRRAGGFAAVSALSLAAPLLDQAAAVPFALIAVGAAFLVDDGPIFDLFARPPDRRQGRLYSLAGFSLAAACLAFLATVPAATDSMPITAFVASVLVVGFGNLGAQVVVERGGDEFLTLSGFAALAFVAAFLGQIGVALVAGVGVALSSFAFHAALAALVGALARAMLFSGDDAAVLFTVGAVMLVFGFLNPTVHTTDVAVGLGVTLLLGYASYATGTASVEGMLSGVLLCLLTVVLGGPAWFVLLVSFYAIGALSTKFRYDAKKRRGVAEENEGARGTGNVLGNSAVALASLLGFTAAEYLPIAPELFLYAFAGSLAAAMGDTLSSELGGLFDNPRLITSGRVVPPGTDGAVTWQGELAGIFGSLLVGVITVALLPVSLLGGAIVAAAGVVGMTVDSLLGATVEGDRIENEAVNLLATLGGALSCIGLAVTVL
jgi:uncharacterized protein (TIGR00297 family)